MQTRWSRVFSIGDYSSMDYNPHHRKRTVKVLPLILALALCTACETTTPAQRQAQAQAQAREHIERCKAAYAAGIGKPVEQWTEADKAGFRQAYFQVIQEERAEQQARFAQQEQTDQIVNAINQRNNYSGDTYGGSPMRSPVRYIPDPDSSTGGTIWGADGSHRVIPDGNGGFTVW
jgi:hypothetical protein